MILSQAQAEAVYNAMCALNNVSMNALRTQFPGPTGRDGKTVSHIYVDGVETNRQFKMKVAIYSSTDVEENYEERYSSQAAFAAAYGLN